MTTLDEAMEQLGRSRVGVHVESDLECLVAIAGTPRAWRVAFRLMREHKNAPWSVTESSMAPRGHRGLVNMTGNDIREVPWGTLMATARQAATDAASSRSQPASLTRPSKVNLSAFAARGAKTDRDYALLALQYVQILQQGDRKPSETLARAAGFGTAGTWTNRIAEARKRGLLTPGRRGEAGGSLTPKAEQLLNGSN